MPLNELFNEPEVFIEIFNEPESKRREKKFISPIPRGGRRIARSAFQVGAHFRILPIASYGTVFAARWSGNGRLEAVISK